MLFADNIIEEDLDDVDEEVTLAGYLDKYTILGCKIKATMYDNKTTLYLRGDKFSINIAQFEGNCGIVIINSIWVSGNNTIGKRSLLEFVEMLSKDMGYSKMLYSTTAAQNIIPALLDFGFTLMEGSQCLNKRSGNWIEIYQKNIQVTTL